MAIQWGNNSALAGFQNALALGADIGGAIRQNRENSALAAFMTAGQGGAPMGSATSALTPFKPSVNAIRAGNLPTDIRNKVTNPDGSISTVRTMSIGVDGGEVLIPTVVGGRVLSDQDAIAHYRSTGENFGTFRTPDEATTYAKQLHGYHEGLLSRGSALGTPPMPTQWGGNGGGIVPTETQKSESQAAYERLAKVNPRLALQAGSYMEDRQAKRTKVMQEQNAVALRQKAAQGDQNALYQLVGIDPDGWKALGAEQRQRVKDINEYTGQAGLRISQLPPEQRAAAWDQVIDNGVARGFKELAEKRGQYSDKALTDAIDGAGLVEKFLSLAEPKYQVVPKDADLVNTRDPAAVAQFGGVAPQQQAQTPPAIAPETALRNATARGYVMPDEAAAIKSGLGSNGQAAFEGWLQQNKVKMVTRTGTAPDGRKVVQFSDGTTQYAN